MEWKDTGEMTDKEETPKEEFFDEEQYSPWEGGKDKQAGAKLVKLPVLFFLLTLAIVALVVALLVLVMDGNGDQVDMEKIATLEGRINQLEERLDKYGSMDEKVALIWKEAKNFGTFKDQFERTEASMSLRMDHLTMSLEAMQKQINSKTAALTPAKKEKKKEAASGEKKSKTAAVSKLQYHKVKSGETLYSISKRYGLKVDSLLKMNKMASGSVIVVGQKLVVRK